MFEIFIDGEGELWGYYIVVVFCFVKLVEGRGSVAVGSKGCGFGLGWLVF